LMVLISKFLTILNKVDVKLLSLSKNYTIF